MMLSDALILPILSQL